MSIVRVPMPSKSAVAAAEPIPLSAPQFAGKELAYLKACLDTAWVSSAGPFVDQFEQALAAVTGAAHAVATINGTAALHVALLIAGVQPDEEVVVSTLSFIAPANAVRYVGARPVFMDADPRYWQMDPDKLAAFLSTGCRWSRGVLRNRLTGRRVRAVLPVHVLGHPCDMVPILELARRYDLAVIEDATESLGARYQGHPVGHLGDVACFSFNGNKIITTGGGGMLVTDRASWARRARYLTTQAKDDPQRWIHRAIGYNYRLSNVQAALGCAQMEQLRAHGAAKRRLARVYADALGDVLGLTLMPEAPWARSIFWQYTVLVDEAAYGMTRDALQQRLQQAQIDTQPLWQPLHQSPAHRGAQAYRCTVAPWLVRRALRLPSSVGLTPAQQDRVISLVRSGAQAARNGSYVRARRKAAVHG